MFYNGVVRFCVFLHGRLSESQSGRMRWYATAMVGGLILLLGVLLGGAP